MDDRARGRPPERPSRNREDSRQKSWRHFEKIAIDTSRFPDHVKPAAVIIGVRGSNHARLQDESGCCIQLRGKGISSPGTPGSDESMHLWVKYDTPEQFARFQDVLEDIINSCQRGPPPDLRRRRAAPYDTPSHSRPNVPSRDEPGPPPLVGDGQQIKISIESLKPTSPPTSALQFLWTLHLLCHYHGGELSLARLEGLYRSLFGFACASDALLGQPIVLAIQRYQRAFKVTGLSYATAVVVPLMALDCQIGNFRAAVEATPPPQPPEVPTRGNDNIPSTPLLLTLQGMHYILAAKGQPATLVDLQREFEARLGVPLDFTLLEERDIRSVVARFPEVFRLVMMETPNGTEEAVVSQPNVDFVAISQRHNRYT